MNKLKAFENFSESNNFYVIKHKSGLFLKHEYVTKDIKKSSITLVEDCFPRFTSEESALEYINDGDELFYTYDDDIRKADLEVVKLRMS